MIQSSSALPMCNSLAIQLKIPLAIGWGQPGWHSDFDSLGYTGRLWLKNFNFEFHLRDITKDTNTQL